MRFARQGLLAINPQALLEDFPALAPRLNGLWGDLREAGTVAVIDIQGPLEQYASNLECDSYAAIRMRVELACETSARAVVLRIDSPGGVASGMIDTARAIRATCAAAGKRLISYVDGQACSAAYAIACAAPEIVTSETGILGSIGIINCRVDVTEADKALGTRFAIVTSGARKADGHPHAAISEAELASTQRLVDSLALTFFDFVGEVRGMSRATVSGLEAGLLHGNVAVGVGLADRVQSFDGLLATLAGADLGETMANANKKYEDARAALGELAGGEGEEAEAARRALAAMDDKPKPEEEAKAEDDAPPADDKPEEEARAEDEKPPEEAKAGAKARTVSAATAGAIAAHSNDLAARVARLEAMNEALQRREFLSSRPDLPAGLIGVLANKPLAEVRAIVGAIPAPRSPKLGDRAAAASVTPTQGEGAATPHRLPPEAKAQLDREMGLAEKRSVGVEKSNYKLVLGAPVDVSVRKGVSHG